MIETPPLGSIVNDMLDPSFEAVGEPTEIYRNLETNPSFEAPLDELPEDWSTTEWSLSGDRSLRIPPISDIVEPDLVVSEPTFNLNHVGDYTIVGTLVPSGSAGAGKVLVNIDERSFGGKIETIYVRDDGYVSPTPSNNRFADPTLGDGMFRASYSSLGGPAGIGHISSGGSPAFYRWIGPIRGVLSGSLTVAQAEVLAYRLGVELGFRQLSPDQAFTIVARNPDQQVFLDGVPHHTTTFPNETVRIAGPGRVGLGEGWWDNMVIAESHYDGEYFDGDHSPDPDLAPSWTGAPNASASILSHVPGVANGWSTDLWSASGERSLWVPKTADWSSAPEDVAIANLADDQRFSIVARDTGQQVFLDGSLYYTTKQSQETVVVKSPGYVVLGEGYWDNGMVVRKDYDGPYFDGDTPPFRYRGQVVRPAWMEGDPGFAKSQLTDYYETEPWTPTVEWSKPENRRFTIGADRGMLYRNGVGVPWSGLVSVNRNGNDSEVGKRYLDGILFNVSVPPSDFSASLEAFTYPDEFDACIGNANYNGVEGLTVHGQESEPFDLCYRTLQGDGNGYGEDYVLHFVYGCMAVDSGHDHASINDSPEAETFSFEIHGVPQTVPNARPSSYFSIDSRKVNRVLLEGLEQVLYGADGAQPRIPTMEEIEAYFA